MKILIWLIRILLSSVFVMTIFDIKRAWGADLVTVNAYLLALFLILALCFFIVVTSFFVDWEEE